MDLLVTLPLEKLYIPSLLNSGMTMWPFMTNEMCMEMAHVSFLNQRSSPRLSGALSLCHNVCLCPSKNMEWSLGKPILDPQHKGEIFVDKPLICTNCLLAWLKFNLVYHGWDGSIHWCWYQTLMNAVKNWKGTDYTKEITMENELMEKSYYLNNYNIFPCNQALH